MVGWDAHGASFAVQPWGKWWIMKGDHTSSNPRGCFKDADLETGLFEFVSGAKARDSRTNDGDLSHVSLTRGTPGIVWREAHTLSIHVLVPRSIVNQIDEDFLKLFGLIGDCPLCTIR